MAVDDVRDDRAFRRKGRKHLVESDARALLLLGEFRAGGAQGPLGLLYNRKTPAPGRLSDRIGAAFKAALGACVKLENEPEFQGKLKFKAGEALFIANDRLNAPNTEDAFEVLRSDLASAARAEQGGQCFQWVKKGVD